MKFLLKRLNSLDTDGIIAEVETFSGSWAFIYARFDLKRLFIGRDVFGRKSLLWSFRKNELFLSQLVVNNEAVWSEVPAGSILILSIGNLYDFIYVFSARQLLETRWTMEFTKVSFNHLPQLSQRLLILSRAVVSPLEPSKIDEIKEFCVRFDEAVKRCISGLQEPIKSVAVLFSGGVDSLLVAMTVCRHVSSCNIDLINVSFDDKSEDFGGAPDRQRGLNAFRYLKGCYPEACYRLILVNVDRVELSRCRSEFIASLIAPSCSVLDDSIGCVQWFAARGEGLVYQEDVSFRDLCFIRSDASVVLVGSGADEIFGGYMRHRHCYSRSGRNGVLDELQKELEVIGERNLGRDDRVTSSHHREVRAPYLDDMFVEWANGLPLEMKADFSKPRGFGEKQIIRKVLQSFGVPENLYAAPKQAMQFGTRIAHLENADEKGSDVISDD